MFCSKIKKINSWLALALVWLMCLYLNPLLCISCYKSDHQIQPRSKKCFDSRKCSTHLYISLIMSELLQRKEFDPNEVAATRCRALLSKPTSYWFHVRDDYIKTPGEAPDETFVTEKSTCHMLASKTSYCTLDVRFCLSPSKDTYIRPTSTPTLSSSSPAEQVVSKYVVSQTLFRTTYVSKAFTPNRCAVFLSFLKHTYTYIYTCSRVSDN